MQMSHMSGEMQAQDDSTASFQMLQQQGTSPGHQGHLEHLAQQLQDTQAELLASQVICHDCLAVAPVLTDK